MPQPTRSDIDLKLFNFTGEVLQGLKKGGHAMVHALQSPVPWVLVGGALALLISAQLRR